LIRIPLILLVFLLTFPAAAEPPDEKELLGEELFAKYQTALHSQKDALKNVDMEVLMEGKIPKLKKEGKMSAMKSISSIGRVTWKLLGFWGDDTVKKEVMARYMSAEQEASSDTPKSKNADISITEDNYKFKYKGLNERDSRQVHIFELKPKHKRVGLFKGELWLDPETCLPVRETGRLVKNPSLFIKKMEFTRDYDIREGVSYLVQMESRTETRIVGRAELNIKYANFHKQESEIKAVEGTVEEARGAHLR
jgi:hypothetical protein